VIAAAVALRGAGAPRSATVALTLAGVVGAVDHALRFGPIAMGLFVYAVHTLARMGGGTSTTVGETGDFTVPGVQRTA
jgi:hypothetical protein